ncbi:hypothetical protein LLG95_08965 [bacterium]|nr:hypothetical protein [bacterium]
MNPVPRRLKWIYVTAAILIGVPLVLIAALLSLSKINAITPAQRQFPAASLKPKTAEAAPSRPHAINTIPTDVLVKRLASITTQSQDATIFDELAQSCPNREAAEIYARLTAEYKAFRDSFDKVGLNDWSPGQPLTDAQKKWLIEHQAVIADLIKLAAAGGIPMVTVEQAMALDPKVCLNMPVPNFLSSQVYGKILAAETSRLVEAGDFRGAAQTLMATMPLAQSISEPFIINHLVAVAMEGVANRELADWLSRSAPPADIARQLRDQLAATALNPSNLLETSQLEYQSIRQFYIGYLDGSFNSLLMMNLGNQLGRNMADLNLLDSFYQNPFLTSRDSVIATWQSAWMRSDPAWALETFDNAWQQSLRIIETNQPANVDIDSRVYVPLNNAAEILTRTDQTLAQLRANLAALDLICGGSGAGVDPFTNEPIRILQQPDGTLIYSLGPDRQDQQGAVTYDPHNGTISAGDIVVRIPR